MQTTNTRKELIKQHINEIMKIYIEDIKDSIPIIKKVLLKNYTTEIDEHNDILEYYEEEEAKGSEEVMNYHWNCMRELVEKVEKLKKISDFVI